MVVKLRQQDYIQMCIMQAGAVITLYISPRFVYERKKVGKGGQGEQGQGSVAATGDSIMRPCQAFSASQICGTYGNDAFTRISLYFAFYNIILAMMTLKRDQNWCRRN